MIKLKLLDLPLLILIQVYKIRMIQFDKVWTAMLLLMIIMTPVEQRWYVMKMIVMRQCFGKDGSIPCGLWQFIPGR